MRCMRLLAFVCFAVTESERERERERETSLWRCLQSFTELFEGKEIIMGFWRTFCGTSNFSYQVGSKSSSIFLDFMNSYSCFSNILTISIELLLLLIFISFSIHKLSSRLVVAAYPQSRRFSPLVISTVIFNSCLGFVYLGLGVWIIIEQLRTDDSILPLHGWVVVLVQGFSWLVLILITSTERRQVTGVIITLKASSILALLIAVFLCVSSLWEIIEYKVVSVKNVLDILSFPGAILVLLYAFKGLKYEETAPLYMPLQGQETVSGQKIDADENVTPFARAGILSKMSFWWLNPLMKKGKRKTLHEKDIPQLRREDRAETCYLLFLEQLSKQTKKKSSEFHSIFSTLFNWQRKEILISGLFAFMKILTISTGPLLLYAFIEVAEGKEAFKYECYALALGLFFAKCLESLSERQWFFRTRLIGLQIRSVLCSAIYQKQLKLSNAAQITHSPGQIMNYVTVDAYKIGEFPYWFHQIWSTSLQLCLALIIIYYCVGLATIAALVAIILSVVANSPLAKLQHKYQSKLMVAQDRRLKATAEALSTMKVLKLYAWETHFKRNIEGLRSEEYEWLSAVLKQKGYYLVLFWASPILVSVATFTACYFLDISLNASNVFTFLATLRLAQEPIRLIPDVATAWIDAKVSLTRIVKFLEAPELENKYTRKENSEKEIEHVVLIRSSRISWDYSSSVKPVLRDVCLRIKRGEKVAICGEVGSGKSTLLATVLGEVPSTNGTVQANGKTAYVSQTAWIQSGTIQENILFGSRMNWQKYQEAIERCSLIKDLELLPFGDLTQIGERGINLSGGQKQRVQLARALYQDADIYLLDDPFSAVDAQTATSLFNEYVMGALSGKTVLLVTHQVYFLPAFDSVLFLSAGEIIPGTYHQLMASSKAFQDLVHAHSENSGSERHSNNGSTAESETCKEEIKKLYVEERSKEAIGDQLIKEEEREIGDTGLRPYNQYLHHGKGFLYFSLATLSHIVFIAGQMIQNILLAANIQKSGITEELITVYSLIGCSLALFLLGRSYFIVLLGLGASKSIFSTLQTSLFRAPMGFYDATPLGRILSRVSSDLNTVDLDLPVRLTVAVGTTMNTYTSLILLAIIAWPVVFVIIPMIYLIIILQKYYFASAKELMRLNGTTKSFVASHLGETIAGSMTIRAFGEEDRFFSKFLDLIDRNARPFFHSFTANEWLFQRLELLCAIVLTTSALAMSLLSLGSSMAGYIGMGLSYGLSLNLFVVFSVQSQCMLTNQIVSIERLEQYMHIPCEAPEIVEDHRPTPNWPAIGEVQIHNLKVRYRPNAPLVLQGISCTFEGGDKIGIVGRTGSGKTTLISALFRLVEPEGGKIIIDEINISRIGLHDLRSHIGIIPQDPTLFGGSVRYNLDPLSQHTDLEIWEVLEKCQLQEAVEEKEEGLNSLVVQDGTNWSMGQRQLFCLGRALLKRSRILVLDEATASIDNATDFILQKTIRSEFADCTVITVAHRIPTVMDCTMILAISDGKVVEYDEPMKLMKRDGSLFGKLVKEYWSHTGNASDHKSKY